MNSIPLFPIRTGGVGSSYLLCGAFPGHTCDQKKKNGAESFQEIVHNTPEGLVLLMTDIEHG